MARRLLISLMTIPAITSLLGFPPPVRAADTSCAGGLRDASVAGDLVVPEGASCALRDVTVQGDLRVRPGAALRMQGRVAVLGNVEVDQCAYASLDPSTPAEHVAIAGNVEIEHCTEVSGKLFTTGHVAVAGNFSCRDNAAPCFAVSLTVGGDMLIDRNAGGMSYIEGNTIGGNLECIGNRVTDYGNPNTVGGRKLGECAGLSE